MIVLLPVVLKFNSVSNRIWRHCRGISGFPGDYGEVVSGQPMLKVEHLQSKIGKSVEFVEFWPRATDPLGQNLDFQHESIYFPHEDS